MNTKLIALFALALTLASCSKAVVTMPRAGKHDRATTEARCAGRCDSSTGTVPNRSHRGDRPDVECAADRITRRCRSAECLACRTQCSHGIRKLSVQTDQAGQQATGSQSGQPGNEIASEGVVDYSPPPPSDNQIVVAVDSRGRSGNLPFLEGMTPSERHHYFQALWLQNSENINITGNTGFARRRFRRRF